jgi:hypothetical protein
MYMLKKCLQLLVSTTGPKPEVLQQVQGLVQTYHQCQTKEEKESVVNRFKELLYTAFGKEK